MRIILIALVAVAATADTGCYGRANVQCEADSNCDLFGGGVCAIAATGNHWCSYPDSSCPSGYRYANQDVGDGVSNVCVAASSPGSDGGTNGGEIPGPYGNIAIRVGGNESSGADLPIRVASAGSDILVIGVLNQSADLGGGARTGTFLVRYNSTGLHLWSKSWALAVTFYDVQADDNGDVFVTGRVTGSVDLGCGSITANSQGEFLLAKFRGSDGACQWSIHAGSGDTAEGHNIAVAGSDLLVTGNFGGNSGTGTLTLGTSVLTSGGLADIFVARFRGLNGQPVWATSFPGTKNDYVWDITVVDQSSFALIGSFFGGTLTIGTTAMTSQAFVTRYKSDGSGPVWVQQYNSGGVGDPHGVAALPSGDLALATNFSSPSISFGNFTLPGTGSSFAVVKLDAATGTATSGQVYGNSTSARVEGLVALPNGNLAGAAQFGDKLSFGNTELTSGVGQALAVFQLSTDGNALSAKRYGGANEQDFVTSMRRCASNEVVLTGTFLHTIDFGAGAPLTSAGSQTIFATRIAP
jgi:hypothetical protein